jgi:hypothetical protein
MSEILLMRKLLNGVLEKINELEEQIKVNSENTVELKNLKKQLMTQTRMKITLIKSIQELTPSENSLTIYNPLKKSIFSRIKSFFRINPN